MPAGTGRRVAVRRIAPALGGIVVAFVLVFASLPMGPGHQGVTLWIANGEGTEPLVWSSGPPDTTVDNSSNWAEHVAFPPVVAHFAALGNRTNSTLELNLTGLVFNAPGGPGIIFWAIASGKVAPEIAPTAVTIAVTATNVSGYAPGILWIGWSAGTNVSSPEPDLQSSHDQFGVDNGSAWVRTDLGNQSRSWNGSQPAWYFFEVDALAEMSGGGVSGWLNSSGQYLFEVTLNGLSGAVESAVDVRMIHTVYS
jgi:hypothetical protein